MAESAATMMEASSPARSRMDCCPELWEKIFLQLETDKKTLKNACLVSKVFYSNAVRVLYRSVVLRVDDGDLETVDAQKIPDNRNGSLQHTRGLLVQADWNPFLPLAFHEHNHEWYSNQNRLGFSKKARDPGFRPQKVQLALVLLMKQMDLKTLRKFHFTAGVSSAKSIMACLGKYLDQAPLEDLAFDFCSACTQANDGARGWRNPKDFLRLLQKKTLKSLKWRIERWQEVTQFLQPFLRSGSFVLEKLDLELTDTWDLWYGYRTHFRVDTEADEFFSKQILGLRAGKHKILFTALRELRLRGICLDTMEAEILCAFNIGRLEELHLDQGSAFRVTTNGWHDGNLPDPTAASSSFGSLRLKKLELKGVHSLPNLLEDQRFGVPFLGSMTRGDLEIVLPEVQTLRIHIFEHDGPISWTTEGFETTIQALVPQLSELVLHAAVDRAGEDDTEALHTVSVPWEQGVLGLLEKGTNLVRLGLSGFPIGEDLKNQAVGTFANSSTFQTTAPTFSGSSFLGHDDLYVRGRITHGWWKQRYRKEGFVDENGDSLIFTLPAAEVAAHPVTATERYPTTEDEIHPFITAVEEVEEVVELMFSLANFPNLKAIGLGDFSHGRRLEGQAWMVFCRNENYVPGSQEFTQKSFRVIRSDDTEIWNILNNEAEFFGSILVDPLVPWLRRQRFDNSPGPNYGETADDEEEV